MLYIYAPAFAVQPFQHLISPSFFIARHVTLLLISNLYATHTFITMNPLNVAQTPTPFLLWTVVVIPPLTRKNIIRYVLLPERTFCIGFAIPYVFFTLNCLALKTKKEILTRKLKPQKFILKVLQIFIITCKIITKQLTVKDELTFG